jgi:hypothetical protein
VDPDTNPALRQTWAARGFAALAGLPHFPQPWQQACGLEVQKLSLYGPS